MTTNGFHNHDIEKRFLGAALGDGLAKLDLAPGLNPGDFSGVHRLIFEFMRQHNNSGPIDPLVMQSELKQSGHDIPLETIFDIYNAGLGYVDAKACAQTLQELRTQRQILDLASKLSQIAHANDISGNERREAVYHALLSLEEGHNGDGLRSLSEIGDLYFDDLEAARMGKATITPTGYSVLDRYLGGWKHGALYTVGARTGQGKTALLLNLAARSAQHGPVLLFSLEMSASDIFKRLLVTKADVSLTQLASDHVPDQQFQGVVDAIGHVSEYQIWIDDTPALDLPTLRARAQRFKLQHSDLSLVCVDYIQLCQLGEKVGSRYLEVGMIATGFKQLARELSVPVITAAQLNRSADARADKTPLLSDIRESGNIEQDSDAVLLLHRLPGAGRMIPTDLIIAKNRHGPTGKSEILFNTKTVSFVQSGGTQ